jgi:hypothetical protein
VLPPPSDLVDGEGGMDGDDDMYGHDGAGDRCCTCDLHGFLIICEGCERDWCLECSGLRRQVRGLGFRV